MKHLIKQILPDLLLASALITLILTSLALAWMIWDSYRLRKDQG